MASSFAARLPYGWTATVCAATLAAAAVIAAGLLILQPWTLPVTHTLGSAAMPVAAVTLLVLFAGTMLALSPRPARGARVARIEEPLLAKPRVPALRRDCPLVVVVGIAPKSGASTVATNLALLVAADGHPGTSRTHRPRSLCLMDGPAEPGELQATGRSLGAFLATHPTAGREEILELTIRHASGAEFLLCTDSHPNGFQLRQMLPVLRRFYQLIVLDAWTDDPWTTDIAMELADAVLLVTPGDVRMDAVAVGRWTERIWLRGLEDKTVLVINRRAASQPPMSAFGFPFRIELPEEGEPIQGQLGLPVFKRRSASWRQLHLAASQLLPTLYGDRAAT